MLRCECMSMYVVYCNTTSCIACCPCPCLSDRPSRCSSLWVAVFLDPWISAVRGTDGSRVGLQAAVAGLWVRVGDPARLLHRVHAHDFGLRHMAEALVVGYAAASVTCSDPVLRNALFARLWIVFGFGTGGCLRSPALVWYRRGWGRWVAELLLPAASAVCSADIRRVLSNARVTRRGVGVGRRRVWGAAAAL